MLQVVHAIREPRRQRPCHRACQAAALSGCVGLLRAYAKQIRADEGELALRRREDEDAEDRKAIEERQDEPSEPWDKVKNELGLDEKPPDGAGKRKRCIHCLGSGKKHLEFLEKCIHPCPHCKGHGMAPVDTPNRRPMARHDRR